MGGVVGAGRVLRGAALAVPGFRLASGPAPEIRELRVIRGTPSVPVCCSLRPSVASVKIRGCFSAPLPRLRTRPPRLSIGGDERRTEIEKSPRILQTKLKRL